MLLLPISCSGEVNNGESNAHDGSGASTNSGQGANTGGDLEGGGGQDNGPQTGGRSSVQQPCPYYDPECDDRDDDNPGPVVPPSDGDFELVWQDDFSTFDTSRWRRHDHTFGENASYFSYDNVSIEDGKLILRLTQKANYNPQNPDDRPYLGAEVSTQQLFRYARITARIKFARGQGIVSSIFTFSDNANVFWNEIDVEYLGYKEQEVQYNLITSNCPTCGGDRAFVPYPDFLGVAPYADFHEYQITWTPSGISFSVDGLPRWSRVSETMTAEVRIRMNVWPTSGLDPFAGTLDPGAIPTHAEYDFVRIERYVGD